MGSTVSYTDLRENLEKGVCQTWHSRHSPPACQIRPKRQVRREICSWTTWDHHSPQRKSCLQALVCRHRLGDMAVSAF